MPILGCFHSAALLARAPAAPKPKRKKPCERFGSHLAGMPKCRQCGRKTACLGGTCARCLKSGEGAGVVTLEQLPARVRAVPVSAQSRRCSRCTLYTVNRGKVCGRCLKSGKGATE
jgi:hypothetical protein